VGLGIMGRPMAHNLLRAGYPLVVQNRSPGPVAELVAAGAEAAGSPAEAAARADVVITMLVNTEVVEQVALGPDGLAEGLRPGATYVDMSSISPLAARRIATRLAEKGVDALDAPVSGGEIGAREATLVIMVGGSAEAFARVQPIFEALGSRVVHVGEAGAGQVAKACNQLVVGLTIDAVAEALLLASAAGVDPAKVREALLGGFANSRVLDLHGQRMLEHRFAPGARASMQLKDLNIIAEMAEAYGVLLPGARTARQLYQELVESGGADLDHSGLLTLLERQAGRELT
jgi:2-hydroxy-3-oxopropionate reductase